MTVLAVAARGLRDTGAGVGAETEAAPGTEAGTGTGGGTVAAREKWGEEKVPANTRTEQRKTKDFFTRISPLIIQDDTAEPPPGPGLLLRTPA